MSIRIVDNKKIEMSEDEFLVYCKIVESYTTNNSKGEDLFIDLFESDNDGIIIFLKPPSKRQTSFEVFLFLVSLMVHQHLKKGYDDIHYLYNKLNEKIKEVDVALNDLKKAKNNE